MTDEERVHIDLPGDLVLRSYENGWILSGPPVQRKDGALFYGNPQYYATVDWALRSAVNRALQRSGAETLAELRKAATEITEMMDGVAL